MPRKTKQTLLIRCAIIYEKEKSFCLSSKTCAKKYLKPLNYYYIILVFKPLLSMYVPVVYLKLFNKFFAWFDLQPWAGVSVGIYYFLIAVISTWNKIKNIIIIVSQWFQHSDWFNQMKPNGNCWIMLPQVIFFYRTKTINI